MQVRESAFALLANATGGSAGIDDECVGHWGLLRGDGPTYGTIDEPCHVVAENQSSLTRKPRR